MVKKSTRKSGRKRKSPEVLGYDLLMTAEKIRRSRKKKEKKIKKKEADN